MTADLLWTRHDAAVALIRRMDTLRLLLDLRLQGEYDLRATSEMREEYDRLTNIDRANVNAPIGCAPEQWRMDLRARLCTMGEPRVHRGL